MAARLPRRLQSAAAGALLAIAAASPSPDLSTALAPAPGADWVEVGAVQGALVGPFTAHSYAQWLQGVNSTPNTTEAHLDQYGFVAGYARNWEQRGTHDDLTERVFQFDADTGAQYWYEDLRLENLTSSYYKSEIPIEGIPRGFGAVLQAPDGTREFRVEFVKGNLMFVVHMLSTSDDLSKAAVAQAQTEYGSAPATGRPTAGGLVGPVQIPRWWAPAAVGVFVLIVLLTAVTMIVVAGVARRRRQAALAPAGGSVQMSADGAYWWDGQGWRDARADVPPSAQRSPDGRYWWDGRSWRLIS